MRKRQELKYNKNSNNMKTLQNNFTTTEQSKRLLELGVPRWSADEYRDQKGYRHSLDGILDVELFFQNFPDYLPCWSVGRLIEIFVIARGYEDGFMSIDGRNPIKYLIGLFAMNRNDKFKS